MGFKKIDINIAINSLIYFLLAYYIVVFSSNMFIIMLAKLAGFNAELNYKGFTLSDQKWTSNNIIMIYFFGNLISLAMAIFFQRLYHIERKYRKKLKLLYLWLYIISLSWFLGEIIVGAIFQTGIGASLIAFRIPFLFRLLLAVIGVLILLYLGKKAQKHVQISANLYFSSLPSQKTGRFFINQILLPATLGFVIIILLKLPNLEQYNYVDLYMLLSIGLFIMGLFYRVGYLSSITFKSHGLSQNNEGTVDQKISYLPIVILILIIIGTRIGLINSVAI